MCYLSISNKKYVKVPSAAADWVHPPFSLRLSSPLGLDWEALNQVPAVVES